MTDRESLIHFGREQIVRFRPATLSANPAVLRAYPATDKYWHGYSPYYRTHLARGRFSRHRILEIGVGGYRSRTPGGSLRYWRDYFPRAKVVGLDLSAKSISLGDRVGFVQGDQSDPSALQHACTALGGPPDVVIDDGSHVGEHIWASFRHLFPRMAPGSIYVIEDLHTSFWENFGGAVPAPADSSIGLLREAVTAAQQGDRTYDSKRVQRVRPPDWDFGRLASAHIYPGIAFLTKGSEA